MITFCRLLGLKGSRDVLSMDVFLILFRFSIYILCFSIFYSAVIVNSHMCVWVLFSIKSSSFVFHYLRHPASRVSFCLLELGGEKKAAVIKGYPLTSVTGLHRGIRYTIHGVMQFLKLSADQFSVDRGRRSR